jgi:hypothetical protein
MSLKHCTLVLLVAAASLAAQQLPRSSTLPRGEFLANDDHINVLVQGYGSWQLAAPRERLPAGVAGTVATAQVAYVTYMDKNTAGIDTIEFRRSIDGGYTWQSPQTLYTLTTNEIFDTNETRLLAHRHEVYLVFASNGHNLGNGQSCWAMGSADQGQTWSAPVLLSIGSMIDLYDVDEVNAAVSSNTTGGAGSLNVVFEADYSTPASGIEDLYYAQAELQGGQLVTTIAQVRLNTAAAATTTDVNFTTIAADGPVVHVIWTDNRAGGGTRQYDYFSLTSRQNGIDLGTVPEFRHTQFAAPLGWDTPRRPRAAIDLPNVYTFMEHSINGKDDVWMDWSTDLGLTWAVTGVAINTATLGNAGDVDDFYVTAADGRIAVVYVDDRLNGTNNNNNNQAIVAVSHSAGLDFQMGTHLEVPLSLRDPNPIFGIEMVGDLITVVYETNCGSGEDVAISLSSDAGATFTHHDITRFGACGTYPGGVDVDNPRMTLTLNGDCIVTWIDDRSYQSTGLGNSYNNLWISGIHYPQLLDQTASLQGLRYQDDAPLAAGDLALVVLSGTGTATPWVLGNLGLSVNLTYDFWTNVAIGGAFGTPAGPANLNLNFVGANGAAQFGLVPNPTQLLGLPFWAAAVTISPATGLSKFTDPIRFQ